jgi:multidrug efflux pump subunit AcrB
MSLVSLAIEKKTVSYFATFLLIAAGILGYFQLGQLEDPEFTVKTASITTSYPGASPEEVELEVTDLLETKLQEMEEIKNIYSISRAGQSIVKVDIKDIYWADRLPQVWDIFRKKISDIEPSLPPGAGTPLIGDDFGYVFGFLLAMTGEGFSYKELERYAKDLRKELTLVEGVARVDFWGIQDKRIYVDVSQAQLSTLGLTTETLENTLRLQNAVVDAGRVDLQTERFRIAPTGAFQSPEDIANLTIRPTLLDTIQTIAPGGKLKPSSELIQIRDFATISRGYIQPPSRLMRFNGEPSIGISLAPLPGVNVVQVGRAIDKRLQEITPVMPVGLEVTKISWQSDLVAESIANFMINLLQAVLIVLVVLALTMGIRVGILIGVSGLVFPILGTFIVMAIMAIDLQRVSLGALIIAMGMMVDNAIVVVDNFMVRLQQGMDRTKAAIESAGQPAMPLLGATVVACMAFYPIFASPYSTGEYARSLFIVVAISLLLSWVLSQTITPLMCISLIPDPKQQESGADLYGGSFYKIFKGFLVKAIRYRIPFLGVIMALLVVAILGFGNVKQMFFPDASRNQFMIDYWLPEGTRIQEVSADFKDIEKKLMENPLFDSVSSFIGAGPPRFYLPVDPELPYQAYGQLIVNTRTLEDVDAVMEYITPWLEENKSYALTRVRKYGVGSWNDWIIEARFSGPAEADPEILRALAEKGKAILEASPWTKEVRSNWRQRNRKIIPTYSQERGRWTGVSRDDVAHATKRAYDGLPVGLFREGDDLIPIVLRLQEDERQIAAANLETVQVVPSGSTETVPLSQVASNIEVEWEDPIIWRWDRRRAITVQCSPDGMSASALRSSILADFEAIELPPSYTLEWDGEFDTQQESLSGLIPGLIPGLTIMVLITVLLFNAFRPPLIIFLVIPFALIGITAGLLGTATPFGFMALLGAMSLSGMMIKNAVVLLDQINVEQAAGKSPYQAVIISAQSRLRPVVNAAATTIFGMVPLLQDMFWVSMAITIMFGLAFGTVLTMVVVPVLYATFFRIKSE